MKLLLIRHAEAVDLGENGTETDFDRMLTEHGRQQAASLAGSLQALGVVPGLILTSPLVRAMETAAILAKTLTPSRDPLHCDRLVFGERRFKKLTREAVEFGNDITFLVGHNPDMSDYAAWLLGLEEGAIDFDKAAAAMIKFAGPPAKGEGQLKWFVSPPWCIV